MKPLLKFIILNHETKETTSAKNSAALFRIELDNITRSGHHSCGNECVENTVLHNNVRIITLKRASFIRIKLKWSIDAAIFEDFIEALAIVPCIISLTR